MLKKILGVIAVAIMALIAVVATRPADYRVERSLSMKAPPATVYAMVSDFNTFAQWSPWAKIDPGMKKEIEGVGQGATYHWSGNDEVGEGRMTITTAESPSKVDMNLEFIRPWEGKAETGFVIAAEGEGSKVTWWMIGHNNFMAKAAGMFMNISEMIGQDYDKGLAALKPLVETKAEEEAKAAAMQAAATPEGDEASEGEAKSPEAAEAKEGTP